jgi:hypothetical protein
VPERLGNHRHVDAGRRHQARRAVPEVVQPHRRQVGRLADLVEVIGDRGRVKGPIIRVKTFSLNPAPAARTIHSVPDWLHNLPVPWLAVFLFAIAVLVTAAIYATVISLSTGERGRAFASISPGLLPPMGIMFALLVGFLAAEVWTSGGRAATAVSDEASSLRAVVLLSSEFPGEAEAQMRSLVRRHIEDAVTKEWLQMAEQGATLSAVPQPLADLQAMALGLRPESPGQTIAQREIVTSLEHALDARRQRIIVSQSSVNEAKWGAVVTLAILTLFAIAFVHSGNRAGAAIAMALFASAATAAIIMIAVQERPFAGPFAVRPTPLEQVQPTLPR